MSEDVDFDFFDSPRTKTADEDGRNAARSAAKDRAASSRSTSTVTDDAASEKTVTSAKPPTHPKSRRVRRSDDDDGDNDADPADSSPRSNASASTSQSRRTINAKIPSVANDDDDDDRSDDNSDDDDDNNSRARSADRSSKQSGKDDRSSRRSSSVASSGDRRKRDGKDAGSDRSSVLSKEERSSGSRSSKKRNKKSLYLSDDSDSDRSSDVSDTDSDVTQVSPLNSPHEHLRSKRSLNKASVARAKSAGKSRAARDVWNGPDSNGTLNFNQILNSHKDTLDLKVLLQTVLEMENDRSSVKNRESRSRFDAAPGGDFCRPRRNYSFTNDQVTKIDRENQRLMEIILRNAREAKKKKKEIKMAGMNPRTNTRLRPTSSAINRVRQQQKIEAENLGILRRLQQTQPTRELQRDTQIKEYQRQLVFAGCAPLSSIQPRPKPYVPPFAKNGVAGAGDYQSDDSFPSGTGKQRPHSAFVSRPLSGKQTANASVKRRPKSAAVKKETVKDLQLDDYAEDFEAETY